MLIIYGQKVNNVRNMTVNLSKKEHESKCKIEKKAYVWGCIMNAICHTLGTFTMILIMLTLWFHYNYYLY